jgi:NAD(P)-dependent dehydrogenase (short-subunit alcohol dehydrogenase family)
MNDFQERVALVTGSTSGIGLACAEELGRRGARVVVNGRSGERCETAAAALRSAGIEALAVAADVANPDEARRLVEAAAARWGRLDVLVNNAGRPSVAPTAELPPAEWDAVIRLNLSAPFYCAQAAAPHLFERGGVVVNIGSVMSRVGAPMRAAYAASKTGLDGLTRTLAVEWASRGVRAVTVCPGYTRTALVEEAQRRGGFDDAAIGRRTPLGRLAEPPEVARVVAFLASDDAAYITGESVMVDGGWVAYGYL